VTDTAPGAGGPTARPELSRDEIHRYSRHLLLPEVALEGRSGSRGERPPGRRRGAREPAGALPGRGRGGADRLVDFDVVDVTNLHAGAARHGRRRRPKLESARARLADLNPHVRVDTHATTLTSANAFAILEPYDVIVDGTDNFPTRYLVNDACVLLGKPNVYGSIFRFDGQASVFSAGDGPCYRCLYPSRRRRGWCRPAPRGCARRAAGIIGTIQATETIKLILGIGETLSGRLLLFDALRMSFRELTLRKDPDCPVCGRPDDYRLIDYDLFCASGRRTRTRPRSSSSIRPG